MREGWLKRLRREALGASPYILLPGLIIAAGYWGLDQRRAEVEAARVELIREMHKVDESIHELRGLKEAQRQLTLRGALIEGLRKDGDQAVNLLDLLGENAAGNFRLERFGYGRLDAVREWPRAGARRCGYRRFPRGGGRPGRRPRERGAPP